MLRVIWQAPGFGSLVVKVWNRQACLFLLPVAKMKMNYQTRFVDSVSPRFAWQSGRQRIPRGSSKDGEGTPLDWERTGARSIHCTSHLDSHILETFMKGIQPTSIRNFRWPVNCGLRRSSERKAQTSTSKVVATRRISNVWKSWTPSRRSWARISTRRPVQRIAFWDDSDARFQSVWICIHWKLNSHSIQVSNNSNSQVSLNVFKGLTAQCISNVAGHGDVWKSWTGVQGETLSYQVLYQIHWFEEILQLFAVFIGLCCQQAYLFEYA